MRFTTVLAAALLWAGVAGAQVVSPLGGSTNNPPGEPPATSGGTSAATPGAPGTTAAPATHRRRTLAERFDAANTTHDGKLSLEQARKGRLNAVARDFAKIDTEKHGYVTMEQIRAFQAEQRAAHRSARTRSP